MLAAFGALAVISTLFGALTSIASDLPKLENTVQFSHTVDSYMYDDTGHSRSVRWPPPARRRSITGRRSHRTCATRSSPSRIAASGTSPASASAASRAPGCPTLTGGQLQGGSTIPEEFIKNVRQEEGDRTVAEKLVEAGMAFQLSHHWTHKQILTEYLNTIYFGNGALGIEAAARVYFGWAHGYDASNPAEGARTLR